MTCLNEIYEFCETLPGVTAREYPFGEQTGVYKVVGKVFLLIAEQQEPHRISLKHHPDEGMVLRAEYPDHITPGYHLNKRHWSTVLLTADGPADQELLDLVRRSYDLVVAGLPRRVRPPSPD